MAQPSVPPGQYGRYGPATSVRFHEAYDIQFGVASALLRLKGTLAGGGRAGSGADRGGIGQDPVPRHERASASRGPATGRTRREGAYPLYPLIELKLGRLSTQSSAFGAFAPFEVLLPAHLRLSIPVIQGLASIPSSLPAIPIRDVQPTSGSR
jgi:hypothetical protein